MAVMVISSTCVAADPKPPKPPEINSSAPTALELLDIPPPATTFPRDAIVAVIARAYEFGTGRDRFCSPEIAMFNLNNKGVRVVVFAAAYFRTIDGITRHVGQTHGRFSIEPNGITTRGFFQLDTDDCDGIKAYAKITVCLMRDGSDCTGKVRFSDSGKIPLYPHPENKDAK